MVMVLFVSCFVNADKMHGLSKWCVILIWMVSFTVVTGQDCNISNFNNGQISNLNIDIVGMEETYSNEKQIIVPCKHGFNGFFKIKCSGGVWTKVLGDKCTAKSCGHPGESLNADFTLVSGTDFVFPSQVQYKCHEGYIMVSRNPYRRCLDQGWSGNTPTCEAIKCPDITVDENVLVTGNRLQSSYGNVLQFGCRNRLLALYGPLHIRCEGNGQWNEGPPTCDEVKCKVPDIANGRAHNTEYAEGQHLTITCNPGYSPSGRRPQCLNIRKRAGWSQTPLCERVTCQLLQERGTTYLDVYKDRFLPGETVSVKCAQGHWFSFNDQQTQKTITCTESGKWISAGVIWVGPCQVPSQCNLPKRVENAVITENKRVVYWDGARVTYKCRTNYRMEGESIITCQHGQWTQETPTCIQVTCQLPQERENTYLDVNKDQFLPGETVSVICNQGHWFSIDDQQTQKTITCTKSGEWNTAAECQEIIICQDPNDPNLKQWLQSTRYSGYAHYWCKEGFRPTDDTARCTENGWTPNPLCKEVTCQLPQERENTYLDVNKDQFLPGETVSVICNQGHWFSIDDQQTQKTITCTKSGEWNTAAECQEIIICQDPNDPNLKQWLQSTRYSGYAHYWCKEGFRPTDDTARCTENGWTPNPLCKEVTCQLPQERENTYLDVNKDQFLPGETVSVICNQGHWFSIDDQQTQKTITCTKSGEWNTAAECQEIIICQDPNDPNLKQWLQSTRYSGYAHYWCKEGFRPTDDTARCTENGWTPNPLCKEVTCQLPQERENTYLDVNKDQFLPGETVSVICNQGHWFSIDDQQTQKTITCTKSGEWNTAAECQALFRCQDPNDPNLEEQLQSKGIGENAQYQCKEGFTPTDARTATCTENGWTPNPLCKANGAELEKVEPTVVSGSSATTTADRGSEITCGDPPSLPDGKICGNFKAPHKHGDKVRYACGINFTIKGDVKTCENGQWTGETRCLDNGAELEPTVVPGSSATTTAANGAELEKVEPTVLPGSSATTTAESALMDAREVIPLHDNSEAEASQE
ncbi:sushi, von Willebrand factor type A, EGF and pentraxin domain-containing protein 1-like isoform X4 [Gadus chalcogrammus]|uniref:sushi, von Willebrand factor type A, EGF and pentraxin domain-containing protein 1-like isoform X4 n=1 Tax=Gadus chalcogrammus TaxID=1042646 RepID=UPI0024C4B6A9|nr:sushi, von Willebrand factor type A, EGF and pentraxin domain-containing protein 1-like isoform X4 [Gadus chalcogrammus]